MGNTLSNLVTLAGDDDSAGYFTSTFQFNATEGTTYRIAVDGVGFGGASGNFVLSWFLEQTFATVPVIRTNPVSQSVLLGSNVTFTAAGTGPALTYQWFVDGAPIQGATGPSYSLNKVQPRDAGVYTVRLGNGFERLIFSQPAVLEVGTAPSVQCVDKLADIFPLGSAFLQVTHLAAGAALSPGGGTNPATPGQFSLSLGDGPRKHAPEGTSSPTDPLPCNAPFYRTIWMLVTNIDPGRLEFDTEGSVGADGLEVFTYLAVYEAVPGFEVAGNTYLKVCDVTSAGAARQSRVCLNVTQANKIHCVVVTAAPCPPDRTCSPVRLAINVRLLPAYHFVDSGMTLDLNISTAGRSPPYRWRRNGVALPSTGPLLRLSPVGPGDAGTYSIEVNTSAGPHTMTVATVLVDENVRLFTERAEHGGAPELLVMGAGRRRFRLEASPRLPSNNWTPLATNQGDCLIYVDPNIHSRPARFFRGKLLPP